MSGPGLDFHHVEHGEGRPVVVLHGAGVDHREMEACLEPAFERGEGFRRIYPHLPGMGRTPAPETMDSAEAALRAHLSEILRALPTVQREHRDLFA